MGKGCGHDLECFMEMRPGLGEKKKKKRGKLSVKERLCIAKRKG